MCSSRPPSSSYLGVGPEGALNVLDASQQLLGRGGDELHMSTRGGGRARRQMTACRVSAGWCPSRVGGGLRCRWRDGGTPALPGTWWSACMVCT